ncbi:MAG: hypothetical protein PWP76_671 [Candidatus Diapherotrites archaeon]|nr:hypothetical protein [Candidatus Diapherotrites archaeon]MDN5367003.1 hypothetical protein [Candidatus Diapherotrites archaeon]
MSRGDYIRFVVAFLLLYVALRFTMGYLLRSPTAYIVSLLSGCEYGGETVVCGYEEYRIVPECTGIVSISLLLALLFVLPLSSERKIRAAVLGSIFLYILNVLRVYALIELTQSIFAFDLVHAFFWLTSPVLVILYVLWLLK